MLSASNLDTSAPSPMQQEVRVIALLWSSDPLGEGMRGRSSWFVQCSWSPPRSAATSNLWELPSCMNPGKGICKFSSSIHRSHWRRCCQVFLPVSVAQGKIEAGNSLPKCPHWSAPPRLHSRLFLVAAFPFTRALFRCWEQLALLVPLSPGATATQGLSPASVFFSFPSLALSRAGSLSVFRVLVRGSRAFLELTLFLGGGILVRLLGDVWCFGFPQGWGFLGVVVSEARLGFPWGFGFPVWRVGSGWCFRAGTWECGLRTGVVDVESFIECNQILVQFFVSFPGSVSSKKMQI
jgi:hypothetical protein